MLILYDKIEVVESELNENVKLFWTVSCEQMKSMIPIEFFQIL